MSNDKLRILALYLPQYHRVAENDKWWGEGFTDWCSVKNAKKLFKSHKQPHVPMNNEYYDLSEKKTMMWQAELMKKYGVDGAMMYHYYFKKGKKILEKPAESLLIWKDVDMSFCFSWANESWIRSWSCISEGNKWSEIIDSKMECNKTNDGILLEQDYGELDDWKEHFFYLLKFFQDPRYIRKNDCPVFMFYKPDNIECLPEMIRCWRDLAVNNGLQGLYLMGAHCSEKSRQYLDEGFIQEPQETITLYPNRFDNEYQIYKLLNYDDVWQDIIYKNLPSTLTSLGAFTGYDDSPRRGYNSTVICGSTPEKFHDYMVDILRKAYLNRSSFVIINAWNEWGEGMYIEPDEENNYAYLKALCDAKENFSKGIQYLISKGDNRLMNECKFLKNKIINLEERSRRYKDYWYMLDIMLLLREKNILIGEKIKKKGVNKIGVYGIGLLGKHLVTDCKESNVEISFGIDQSKSSIGKMGIKVITINDKPMRTDVIIVTVVYDYERIKKSLKEKYSCEIISLKTLLEEMVSDLQNK